MEKETIFKRCLKSEAYCPEGIAFCFVLVIGTICIVLVITTRVIVGFLAEMIFFFEFIVVNIVEK